MNKQSVLRVKILGLIYPFHLLANNECPVLLVRHAVGISIGLGYNAVVNPSIAPNVNAVSPANQINHASEWMTAQSREQQAKCTVIGSKGQRETVVLVGQTNLKRQVGTRLIPRTGFQWHATSFFKRENFPTIFEGKEGEGHLNIQPKPDHHTFLLLLLLPCIEKKHQYHIEDIFCRKLKLFPLSL